MRTGYDAESGRYTYRDTETGARYIGAPGVEYGPLQPVLDAGPASSWLLPHGEGENGGE